MIKLSFWLRKSNADKDSLEHIIISAPKIDKVVKPVWGSRYICEVYFSNTKEIHPTYSVNPIDTLHQATEFVKVYLQVIVSRGFTVSEIESRESWRLEKKDPQLVLQEKIDEIKNNKSMSQEDKDKILKILKESFGKTVIKDHIDKLI